VIVEPTNEALERIHAKLERLVEIENARSNDVYLPFHDVSTITGTSLLSVWTPNPGQRFRLKGFDVTVIVDTDIAGTDPVVFGFWDDSVSDPIAPVTGFQANDPEGMLFNVSKTLGEGVPSGAADRVLKLGCNATIGAGVLHVFGIVWGDHFVL